MDLSDVIGSLRDVSQALGSLASDVERAKEDVRSLAITIHQGNSKESVMTRIAKLEDALKRVSDDVSEVKAKLDAPPPPPAVPVPAQPASPDSEMFRFMKLAWDNGIKQILIALAGALTLAAAYYFSKKT